jgi:hypothetical protein
MPLPRLKPNVLQAIHLRRPPNMQIRCLRTSLLPRQAAFLPSLSEIRKRVTKQKKTKKDLPKIPLVPRLTDDAKPVKQSPAPTSADYDETKLAEPLTVEEEEEERKLRESEKRIEEFEKEQEALRGKSEVDRQMAIEKQRVIYKDKKKEEVTEKTDNIVYPRDVIGRRFKKERIKYKIDVYDSKNGG